MWGFCHSIFVTVPAIVRGFVRSYCAANEWCASRVRVAIPVNAISRRSPTDLTAMFCTSLGQASHFNASMQGGTWQMLQVFVVFVADGFHQFSVRRKADLLGDGPWSGIGLRIINRDLNLHVAKIHAAEPLD